MQIQAKIAVISGASSGIGQATALALGKKGAHVILLARRKEALQTVADTVIHAGGKATIYPVDLSQPQAVEPVIASILANHGAPDILLNNAGLGRWLAIDETPMDEAIQMMAVPYFAAFQLTRGLLPAMRERHRGHILNITSPAAFMAWENAAAYISARFAMRGFAKALQAELKGSGLKSSLLIPGKVSSDYFANNPGSEARLPGLSRIYKTLTPEEVAQKIVSTLENEQTGEIIFPQLLKWTTRLHQLMPQTVEFFVQKSGSEANPQAFKKFKRQAGACSALGLGLGLLGWSLFKERKQQ